MFLIKLKPLVISLLISLGVGTVSGLLSMGSSEVYLSLNLPAFSPPPGLFPVVWIILYALMGISAYLIYISSTSMPQKKAALTVYLIQLAVNFIWPLIFFNAQAYLLAFIWLILLWILIVLMIMIFYRINPLAAYLQIPYLLWVTFAGYLNLSVYFLNK